MEPMPPPTLTPISEAEARRMLGLPEAKEKVYIPVERRKNMETAAVPKKYLESLARLWEAEGRHYLDYKEISDFLKQVLSSGNPTAPTPPKP